MAIKHWLQRSVALTPDFVAVLRYVKNNDNKKPLMFFLKQERLNKLLRLILTEDCVSRLLSEPFH
jgi:hypothetical protein